MFKLVWTNDAPDPYHLAILQQGVNVWNAWRGMNSQIIPSFHRANLSKENLSNANFKRAEFKEANLQGANLSGVVLGKAILSKADLSEADLTGAGLYEADLSGANLTGANLSFAHFNNTKLSNAKLIKARLIGTKIADANCGSVNFSYADFQGVESFRSIFNEADFSNATFKNALFLGAKLYRANFKKAILNCVKMPRAYLQEAEFSNATIIGVDFSGADLSNANFSGADLTNANLSDANLSNTNLTGAILDGACLVRVKALATDFTGAKLTGACIEDWHPNGDTKFNNIACEYIYRKEDNQELHPSGGRKFAPEEFAAFCKEEQDKDKRRYTYTSTRLQKDKPEENLKSLAKLIDVSKVEAIFDPYLDNSALDNLSKLVSFGVSISPDLRVLTSNKVLNPNRPRLTNTHAKKFLKNFSYSGEIRILQSDKEHRRFMLLSDKTSLIIGLSLNDVSKNEAAYVESDREDLVFFDSEWKTAQQI